MPSVTLLSKDPGFGLGGGGRGVWVGISHPSALNSAPPYFFVKGCPSFPPKLIFLSFHRIVFGALFCVRVPENPKFGFGRESFSRDLP